MDQIELIYSSNRSRKILGVRIEDSTSRQIVHV